MSKYRKAIVAFVGAVIAVVATIPLSGDAEAIVQGIIALLTVLGVYQVPNTPTTCEPAPGQEL